MEFLAEYGLFLLKAFTTLMIIIIFPLICMIGKAGKNKEEGQLTIKNLNQKLDALEETLVKALPKKERKAHQKKQKERQKAEQDQERPSIYVLSFDGDTKASATEALKEEITAILQVANPDKGDEVCLLLQNYGGIVHEHGLAAAQLQRLRDNKIPLTVAIDRVAASGGYLMACVANTILAAPLAIIGSIGVVAQLPNLNRLLKHHHIDFEQLTAGQYKRTLNLLAPNTKEGLKKTQTDVETIHNLFKSHITHYRPQVLIEEAATGEYWYASDRKVKELQLVDQIITSNEYLRKAKESANLYLLSYEYKKKLVEKIANSFNSQLNGLSASLRYLYQKNHFL